MVEDRTTKIEQGTITRQFKRLQILPRTQPLKGEIWKLERASGA